MNCAECEVLLHALIDHELDAGHARDVEAHVTSCSACAETLRAFRAMRTAMAQATLKDAASAALRARIEAALPTPSAQIIAPRQSFRAIAAKLLWRFCRGRAAVRRTGG